MYLNMPRLVSVWRQTLSVRMVKKLTSDEHYTKEEMQNLIKLAKALHINLVPEIDTPGHALSFVKVRPDLMYQGSLSDYEASTMLSA